MSRDTPGPDLDHLRRLLAGRDEQRAAGPLNDEDAAERIARALLDLPPRDLTCDDAQAQLPALVEAELRGAAAAAGEFARVLAHLRACPECSLLHDGVLASELAASEAAEQPAAEPLAMDLSFLGTDPFERLRAFVTDIAHEIIAVLQPAALAQLAYLLDPFFNRARELPRGAQFRPALAPAALGLGGQGRVKMPAAAVYLGACFLAVRELSGSAAPEHLAALQAEGRLDPEARRFALRAAADAGLPPPDAARFADEFVRCILAAATELPGSIDR
jgi:hypothetical protein